MLALNKQAAVFSVSCFVQCVVFAQAAVFPAVCCVGAQAAVLFCCLVCVVLAHRLLWFSAV